MSLTSHTFWISYESGKLLESFTSGAEAGLPLFYQGDTVSVELHLIKRTGNVSLPVEEIGFPAGSTIKLGIGSVEANPTAGTFKLSYHGQLTPDLPFDATATQISVALNDLVDVDNEGGVTVVSTGDAFMVSWNSGTSHDLISGITANLFPATTLSVTDMTSGSVQKALLNLRQSPIAFTNTFTSMSVPVASISLISTIGTTKIYRLTISPSPAYGSFTISALTPGTSTVTSVSQSIDISASASEIARSLPGTVRDSASVIKSGTYAWDISISDGDDLAVDGSGLIGWSGVQGYLSLNTAEVHAFLNGNASGSAVLELAIEEASGETTILQTACTIASDLIESGTLVPVDGSSALAESVANNRFVRRDVDQEPGSGELNFIWLNLGVLDWLGQNIAAALNSANNPSASNPFATMADVGGGGGGGGSYLPLAGGTMTGAIIFDPTGGQNIAKGTFDNGSSGAYQGISLTCAVGYELNWQGGRLTNWFSGSAQPIIFDSPINIASSGGLTFSDSTQQTTAGLPLSGGSLNNSAIITLADGTNDSEVGGWGFGVELTSDNNQSASIEYNQIQVKNSSQTMKMIPAGITFPDSSTQNTAYILGNDWSEFDTMTMMVEAPSVYISSGYSTINGSFTQGSNPISHWYNAKYATAYWGIFINGTLADVISYSTTYYYGFSNNSLTLNTGDNIKVKLGWYDGTSYRWSKIISLADFTY